MRMSIGYLEPLVSVFFGVTFVHANLFLHILALIFQDGGNPFPVNRLPVLNTLTDSLRHHGYYPRYIANGHVTYI